MYKLVNKFTKLLSRNFQYTASHKSFKQWITTAQKLKQAASEGKKKGFLVYQNTDFNIWQPRIFSSFGVAACGMSIFVTYDLRKIANNEESEVSNKLTGFTEQLYKGWLGEALPVVYLVTGILCVYLSRKISNSNIKKLYLSTDRSQVTFVSYRLFGRDKIVTHLRDNISFVGTKVKIKNYSGYYRVMKSGKIYNRTLFDLALNCYKKKDNLS